MSKRPRDIKTVDSPELSGSPASEVIRPARPRRGLRTDLPLWQQVAVLAMWPMLEQFMAFAVGFVDTALAGRLSEEATDAIGAASFVMWLMGLLQGAIGVGATALIARAIGARHKREAHAAVGQAMLMAAAWGLFIAVLFLLTAPLFAMAVGMSGEGLTLATEYLWIVAATAPFMSMLFVGGACLRGAGDFRSPFYIMLVVNAVNIGVSILCVHGPAPFGGMGLNGVAVGTAIAWFIGGLLMVALLIHGSGGIRLHMHRLRLHRHMMWRVVRVGVPSLMENGLMWFGHFMTLAIVGRLENEPHALGAHIIAVRIEAFSFLPGFAFGQAAATMVGQYLGANDEHMARKSAWVCWGYGAAFMVSMGVFFILVPEFFVRMITNKQAFLDVVPTLVFFVGFAQIGFATRMVLSGVLRGAGDTKASMTMTFLSLYLFRLPMVYVLAELMGWGMRGVWIVLSVDLMLQGALFLGRFMQGGWAKVKV